MAGEWYEGLPPELTVEHQGQQIPLRDHSFVKESKDLPSFVKQAFDAHREVGSRIPIKMDKKPESIQAWKKEHLPKLYEAGVLDAPSKSPDEYDVKKPDDLPDTMWSEDNAKEFKALLHKHNIPKAAVADFLAIHSKSVLGSNTVLKTSLEDGIKALKEEYGEKYEERSEMARRLASQIFKTPEELDFYERVGLGNHPAFLSVIMRLAPLAMSDSSFVKDARAGGMDPDEVRNEVAAIMSDPKNPMHEGYHRNDKKVLAHIESLYRKAYGTGMQDIGSGILVGPKPEPL